MDYLKNERNLLKDIRYEDIRVSVSHVFNPSRVSIEYELPVPGLLSRLRGKNKPFTVSGHSECYTDTWALKDFSYLLKGIFKGEKIQGFPSLAEIKDRAEVYHIR